MFKIDEMKAILKQTSDENIELKKTVAEKVIDKDNALKELKELKELKTRSDFKMQVFSASLKEKADKVSLQLIKLNEKYQSAMNELYAKTGIIKNQMTECAGLKERIQLLRKKKGNMHADSSKICKNCNKDFNDKENFNWSCRTHHSQYSGEIWWCCGKQSIDALGCRFSAH